MSEPISDADLDAMEKRAGSLLPADMVSLIQVEDCQDDLLRLCCEVRRLRKLLAKSDQAIKDAIIPAVLEEP